MYMWDNLFLDTYCIPGPLNTYRILFSITTSELYLIISFFSQWENWASVTLNLLQN